MISLATIDIPYFPELPTLDEQAIAEITQIVFGPLLPEKACDVIFIFGGSHPGLWQRGAEAYHAGLGKEVVVTGGYKPTALRHHTWTHGACAEAMVIRDELVLRNVPTERIYAESRSTNTLENVLFAQKVYDFSRIRSILAVCKSYSAGRQCRTLRHYINRQIEIMPYPFDTNVGQEETVVTRKNWMMMPKSSAYIFSQFLKILKYGQLDHLEPVENLSAPLTEIVHSWMDSAESVSGRSKLLQHQNRDS